MSPERHRSDDYLRAFVEDPPPSVRFEEGLSTGEIDDVERRFGFRFPPDLRALLSLGLPVSDGFPNWRSDPDDELQRRLDWPAGRFCFDIEHSGFWYDPWGPRPDGLQDACALARRQVAALPKLVPIYSHRYIPSEPAQPGNPVFSVWQPVETIRYGDDLSTYLLREFGPLAGPPPPTPTGEAARTIPFWDDLVRGRYRSLGRS